MMNKIKSNILNFRKLSFRSKQGSSYKLTRRIDINSTVLYRLLPVVVFCLAAWSCSGEEGASMPQLPEVPQVPADPDALCTITPGAIEISYVDASDTPLTRSATGEPLQKVTQTENLGHNFSVEATLEAAPQEAQTRAAVSMATGAQYRIVVFDKKTNAVVGNAVYKQGNNTTVVSGKTISLKAGTYRLFCYSINSTTSIPSIGTNGDVTVNPGNDFMTYTVADFTVVPTDYANGKSIAISFTRQCTRLTIYVCSDGYNNNTISAATMKVSLPNNTHSTSIWNGLTMDDDSSLTALNPAANVTQASSAAKEVYCGPTASNKYLIIPPCKNNTIRIENLKLTIDGKALTPPSDYALYFSDMTMNKGKSYQLRINASNYYVLTSGETAVIGATWATSNLQQYGIGTSASVSFARYPWTNGSYWDWLTRDAENADGTNKFVKSWSITTPNHEHQDPCTAVENNSNTWRLPTVDEFEYLISKKAPSGTRVKINNEVKTIEDNGWAPSSTESAGAFVAILSNNVLVLPAAGTRSAQDSGDRGCYWSSEDLTVATIYTYEFAYCLEFAKMIGGIKLGIRKDAFRTSGYSLRCVKR